MARIAELAPGASFAGFQVVSKLRDGGMGAVYVVTQIATGRQRALKLMHPELVSNEGLREKFVQEARIGGRIESEHVVDVVDAGVDAATGMPWLAMEPVPGQQLRGGVARRARRGVEQRRARGREGHAPRQERPRRARLGHRVPMRALTRPTRLP
jgi:serine/threonine protein kinase